MNSKLIKVLPDLVKKEVISNEVASKIEQYYSSQRQSSTNKLFIVFGVLGSLLVGLGMILILAHNWDDFDRITKTFFAFIPLLISQFFVSFSILKKKSITWKEASGTFLFFTIGSSIALVSQIYNIPGDLSTYVLTWIVLSLPLIYILKSNAVAGLNIVYITFYGFELGYGYYTAELSPWLYIVLVMVIVPHYVRLLKHHKTANISSIFNWLFPLSITIVLGAFVQDASELGFLMYLLLFSLCYNIGKIPFFNHQKLRQNGYAIFGSLGIVILLLTMSFESFWHFEKLDFNAQETYMSIGLFMANAGVLLYAYAKKWLTEFNVFQYVFILYSILYSIGFNFPIIGTIIVNMIVLVLGITTIKIGVDKLHFGILNYGLLVITALVICRFFDTNMSFILRGSLFVAVGLGFFITNFIMLKKQKLRAESFKY